MQSKFAHLWVPLLGVVLLLTSCETTEKKRAISAPPVQAQAPTITAAPATPTPQPKPGRKERVTKADPVEILIAAAEKEYQAGRANFNAGHLEAAKTNFDRAFDMLLQGPGDVRGDDRLMQQFDKIVEGVHQLELLALKEGDGFTEQSSEPAPIDEANEVTFPVDPNIKARAEEELKTTQSDLPLTLNDTIASYINYFSSRGKGTLEHGYIRSGRYRDMIVRTLREEGVPQDLIYLAQAESGFKPVALSRAGARGMWQFMPSRGSEYGLARSWWVDERLDPAKSTRAAARHLKDLYKQFGDWYLALAAYNSGPGTVQRAVERTGYADYWELHRRGVLPAETRNYVPIILAITIMTKNPAQYGLDRLRPDISLPYDTVTINYPVDLRLAAECADTSVSMMRELNPSLLRSTTPKDHSFELHVPLGTREKYETAIASIPVDMRVSWRYHRVAPGDTLASIAKKYRTSSEAIQKANDLPEGELRAESKLIIPASARRDGEGESPAKQTSRYKVRKGDTVLTVADAFSISPAELRKWNGLTGNKLKAGRMLRVSEATAASSKASASRKRSKRSVKTAKAVAPAASSKKATLKKASNKLPAEAQTTKGKASSTRSSKSSESKSSKDVKTSKTKSADVASKTVKKTSSAASKSTTSQKSKKKRNS